MVALSLAVDQTAVARVVGIKVIFEDLRGGNVLFLPQRVIVIGQGSTVAQASYSTTKTQVLNTKQVGDTYGYGSPLYLAVQQLLPANGDGVGTIPVTVYPLKDDVSGVAAAGSITPTGSPTSAASYRVNINEVFSETFVIDTTDVIATIVTKITNAINANIEVPVTAVENAGTSVDIVSKWKGVSANDIKITVEGESNGVVFGVVNPTGGLVNPTVTSALSQIGDVWETLAVNCLNVSDEVTLDEYATFNEGRWGSLVRKPMVFFSGAVEADVTTASTLSESRKTDRTNSQINAPGSNNLPFVVAARAVARIAPQANNNPPVEYAGKQMTNILPGTDEQQWNYLERDFAVKRGASTISVLDSVIEMEDTVTFYHPTGENPPAYRYVVDIIRIQNIIFNFDLIFASDNWKGKVLLNDDDVTVNPEARKPKDAVAAIATLSDNLVLQAITADSEFTKNNTFAGINESNPKRLDVTTTVKLSGNTNIISIDLNFGFNFGTQAAAA